MKPRRRVEASSLWRRKKNAMLMWFSRRGCLCRCRCRCYWKDSPASPYFCADDKTCPSFGDSWGDVAERTCGTLGIWRKPETLAFPSGDSRIPGALARGRKRRWSRKTPTRARERQKLRYAGAEEEAKHYIERPWCGLYSGSCR